MPGPDTNDVLAYFYCNYREETRRDPAFVLRALVKQLCLVGSSNELPEIVLSIYQKRVDQGHQTGPLHLDESRDLIVALSTGFAQTTIIIDALDECNRDTRRGLFLTLKHIINSTAHVRIFLTGRNDDDILRILHGFPSHYLDATDNSGDISTYINSEIQRCSREGLLLDGEIDQGLESEIVLALEKGADGMYVFLAGSLVQSNANNTTGLCGFICRFWQYVENTLPMALEKLSERYRKAWTRHTSKSSTV